MIQKAKQNKIKEFYKKYKAEIITGCLIVGGIAISYILKPDKEIIEKMVIPNWAEKWKSKCNDENLLYENGLPIFANDKMTAIYSDAFADEEVLNIYKENGFEIVGRV